MYKNNMKRKIILAIIALTIGFMPLANADISTKFNSINMEFPQLSTKFETINMNPFEIPLPYKSDPTINKNINLDIGKLNKHYDHEEFQQLLQQEIIKAEAIRDKLLNTQTRNY